MKPRLLMVARERYTLPLDESLRRKFDAIEHELDVRVLASASDGGTVADDRFRLVPPFEPRPLDGASFYAALPARIARELRSFRPDAVLVQGTHETAAALLARRLASDTAPVILDLHGDWRAAPRLYGSPLRRLLGPPADLASRVAVRRADAIRTISSFTTGLVRELGREPAGVFPAFLDFGPFLDRPPTPPPERPAALFVGVLERYKNVHGLASAWRLAAARVPGGTLHVVGRGHERAVIGRLVAQLPRQTTYTSMMTAHEVARALDHATALVLPSRSEGLGRVVIEAFCRGRAVIGTRVGGIPDLVEHERNGLLVESGDVAQLADALVRVLTDRELARRLGEGARTSAERWIVTPDEFARRLRALVDGAQARSS